MPPWDLSKKQINNTSTFMALKEYGPAVLFNMLIYILPGPPEFTKSRGNGAS